MEELDQVRKRLKHKDRLPAVPTTSRKEGMVPVPTSSKRRRMEWRYQAYDDLMKKLGHGDGMAEVIEIARRDFIDSAEASGDPRGFLTDRAKAQKISVYQLDVANLPARAAVLYIVGAHQQFEGFLKEIITEIDQVHDRKSRVRLDKEAPLDWALDVLPGGKTRNILRIWKERYLVLEYYRVVRNAFVHKVKQSSIDEALENVQEWSIIYRADFGLEAPNAPNCLNFDDFLLFTRTIKYVANDLCRLGRPSRLDIIGHASREFSSGRRFDWYTISKEKAAKKIEKFYKGKYFFDLNIEENLIDEILTERFEAHGRKFI